MNLQSDNEQDIHMSTKKYEDNGYGFDLDLLTILYKLFVSHLRRKWASWMK